MIAQQLLARKAELDAKEAEVKQLEDKVARQLAHDHDRRSSSKLEKRPTSVVQQLEVPVAVSKRKSPRPLSAATDDEVASLPESLIENKSQIATPAATSTTAPPIPSSSVLVQEESVADVVHTARSGTFAGTVVTENSIPEEPETSQKTYDDDFESSQSASVVPSDKPLSPPPKLASLRNDLEEKRKRAKELRQARDEMKKQREMERIKSKESALASRIEKKDEEIQELEREIEQLQEKSISESQQEIEESVKSVSESVVEEESQGQEVQKEPVEFVDIEESHAATEADESIQLDTLASSLPKATKQTVSFVVDDSEEDDFFVAEVGVTGEKIPIGELKKESVTKSVSESVAEPATESEKTTSESSESEEKETTSTESSEEFSQEKASLELGKTVKFIAAEQAHEEIEQTKSTSEVAESVKSVSESVAAEEETSVHEPVMEIEEPSRVPPDLIASAHEGAPSESAHESLSEQVSAIAKSESEPVLEIESSKVDVEEEESKVEYSESFSSESDVVESQKDFEIEEEEVKEITEESVDEVDDDDEAMLAGEMENLLNETGEKNNEGAQPFLELDDQQTPVTPATAPLNATYTLSANTAELTTPVHVAKVEDETPKLPSNRANRQNIADHFADTVFPEVVKEAVDSAIHTVKTSPKKESTVEMLKPDFEIGEGEENAEDEEFAQVAEVASRLRSMAAAASSSTPSSAPPVPPPFIPEPEPFLLKRRKLVPKLARDCVDVLWQHRNENLEDLERPKDVCLETSSDSSDEVQANE